MAKNKDKKKDSNANKDKDSLNKSKGGFFGVAKTSVSEFMDDECLNLSAAIAYYALQSVIPLILGFIAVGSLFLQDPGTRNDFINGVKGAIPQEIGSATNFNTIIDGLIKGAAAAGIISVATLLWTGSGIFDQFIYAINKAYDVEKDERNFFVKLLLRLAMLFGLGALLALAFTITILFKLVIDSNIVFLGIPLKDFGFLLGILSYLIPLALEFAIFAILYKFSPARKGIGWKQVMVGALVGAVLFEILKFAFGIYISVFGAADNAQKTYGAIGGIIVFLFFVYLSAAVILFGAEVAAVLLNMKSGMASVKTKDAVVEAKAVTEPNGEMVPEKEDARKNKAISGEADSDKKGVKTSPHLTPPVVVNSSGNIRPAIDTSSTLQAVSYNEPKPEKKDWIAMVTGAIFLVLVSVGNVLFRRRRMI